jgi:cation-transporting ATPase 13A3/4/5
MQLAVVILVQWVAFFWVQQMPWFEPYNSTAEDAEDSSNACFENYALFTVSSLQYIILALVFSKGAPYRKSIFSNYGFLASLVCLTGFTLYLTLDPAEWLRETFELMVPPTLDFRLIMVMLAFVNTVLAVFIEYFIIDYLMFRKLLYRFHNVDKSHRKFLALEKSLQRNQNWPPITEEVVTDVPSDLSQKQPRSPAAASVSTLQKDVPHNREMMLTPSVLVAPKRRHYSDCSGDHLATVSRNATLPRCQTADVNSISVPNMNRSVLDIQ